MFTRREALLGVLLAPLIKPVAVMLPKPVAVMLPKPLRYGTITEYEFLDWSSQPKIYSTFRYLGMQEAITDFHTRAILDDGVIRATLREDDAAT